MNRQYKSVYWCSDSRAVRSWQTGDRGFTLIELLIALSIFAVLSVMAYGGLRVVLDTRDQASRLAERLARLQTAMSLIERDIRQSVARPVRDRFGDPMPAMEQGGINQAVLEITHLGYRNPTDRPRSHMQRVAYTVREDKLSRLSWPVLDRAQNSSMHESVLLEGVKEVTVRFMDQGSHWVPFWPPEELEQDALSAMPKAVELVIDLEDWGHISRLFAVPGR